MGQNSGIEWTEATWNPVTGCDKVSPGCKHCYAERMARRLEAMGQPNYANGFRLTVHEHALGVDTPAAVVRPGETSPEAMREKAAYVLRAMERRLEGLGFGWEDVTVTEVYTVQPLDTALAGFILEGIGPAARHGLRWHHARPPIDELEFEMDLRGVRWEVVQ